MSTAVPSRTWRLLVAYNGARFKGWQRGNGRTVQGTLEEAIVSVVSTRGRIDVQVNGAGRTDAGAHAEGQVASVILPDDVDLARLLPELNRALPSDVSMLSVGQADDRFHARYRAKSKTYRYRIVDGPVPNPFLAHLSWRQERPLTIQAMRDAARFFVGTHDFRGFTQAKTAKSTQRTVLMIAIERTSFAGGPVTEVSVRGDGFLWKQVRAMVGALVAVGVGEIDAGVIPALLSTGDRSIAPAVAPASGLALVSVDYE